MLRRLALTASPARLNARTMATAATLMSDVHGTTHGRKHWRNKPLFRREGDKKFRNGQEAAEMLVDEAVRRDPHETEYLQSVQLFMKTVAPVFDRFPRYAWVMKTIMEPERVIQFRVPWIDDTGTLRVNRGFRVQQSSALGPYMGGLRFHSDVTHATIMFLAFETVFRNALVGPFGAAHGGADFNPIDKSEAEVMRFCQSYMTELANYIGPRMDIPTAGVGVGPSEIGYMFGQYKRLRQLHPGGTEGILGGYHYPQVTGYGVVHFANRLLAERKDTLKGKRCLISGSGTVALSVAEKLIELGAIPIGLSDRQGFVIEPEGFTANSIHHVKQLLSERHARLGGYIMSSTSAVYHPKEEESLWDTPCDYAFPCALQNDIDATAMKSLIDNGCKGVIEGANMPCTEEAITLIKQNGMTFGPHKIANSGALLLAGAQHGSIPNDKLDGLVKEHMNALHDRVAQTAASFHCAGDLHSGANIAGLMNVAQSMVRQGAV